MKHSLVHFVLMRLIIIIVIGYTGNLTKMTVGPTKVSGFWS